MARVTLYGKPGCCLCDETRREVLAARAEVAFDLEEVDVSVDPGLNRDYGARIPVVSVDGVEAFELGVSRPALVALVVQSDRGARDRHSDVPYGSPGTEG